MLPQTFEDDLILRMKDMCKYLGISQSHGYWLRRNDPTFPKPIRLGKTAVGFLASELRCWLMARGCLAH
ncbi:AlpA family phage regulatory protein [Lysobacter soyae]|uniref:AlpA family phage regulatory protein n=1 Tax=Lysobacter soyae TaxID=2764185 RepID=A0ABX8WN81_9GAMM|nr:AlpA family phage regulatory protein [Lysobacter sp. CJ11]